MDISGAGVGVSSLFEYRSWNQNMRSSALNGCPSDHFMPFRKNSVVVRPPSSSFQSLATDGTIFKPV